MRLYLMDYYEYKLVGLDDMQKMGFKTSLVLIISVILISSLCVTSIFSYTLLKDNAESDLYKRVDEAINNESRVISSYIAKNSEPAKALAGLYEKYGFEEKHERLAEYAATLGGVTKVTIGFDDGSSYVSRPSAATFPGGIGIKEKYDPRTRAWYKKGKTYDGLGLSDIFFTKENIPMFGATHPVKNGIILADIRLGQLQSVLEGIDIMDGATGIIADAKGMILASTAKYAVVKNNLSDTPQLAQFASTILSSEQTNYDISIDGVDKLLFSNRIELLGDANMFLLITIDRQTAFAEISSQTTNLVITLFVMLIISTTVLVGFLNYLYKPVIELREVISNLSSGEPDLTQRLEVKTEDDLGLIAGGVNRFIENLQKNMISIQQLTKDISSGVSALRQQTDRSSDILTEHVNQTNTVAVAMQELDSSAEQVADSATEAATLVTTANHQGEASREIIEDAQSSIGALLAEIDKSAENVEEMSQETKDISSVLSVIGSIAEQTNLLALNAAIEAARAGEQGRGFAVVADEVRALAARTQESTGEIESSLTKLRNGADSVVSAIEQTKNTSQNAAKDVHQISDGTEKLIEQVNQVDQISSVISQSANEQNRVIHEISESVNNIHNMVEQLSNSGQDIVKETQSISEVNKALSEIIGKFKLT